MRTPERRRGRSDLELRAALATLQERWERETRRHRRTLDQLRRARLAFEERLLSALEDRRAEDRIRDEYHDSRARTIPSARARPAGKKR